MTNPDVIFVTGDRDWTAEGILRDTIKRHPVGSWLIDGGCRGADLLAQAVCYEYGFQPIRMDALWPYHGNKAGPIRNRQMGKLLAVLRDAGLTIHAYAFHDNLAASKGTKDMTGVLDKLGIPWRHVLSAAARPHQEDA